MLEPNRPARILLLTATGVLAVAAVAEFAWLWGYIESQNAIGADLAFFRSITEHWLATGQLYLPRQLSGPYEVETLVDVLYPPNALLLFVPFVWLPDILWWLIPIAIFGGALAWLRPAMWTWPLITAGIAWPQTLSQLLYGNTNMWVAAAIAAGVCIAWPSVLVLLKPSFAPFALIGINRRRWWVALAILALVSIPFGELWLDYVTAMRNSSLTLLHGLLPLPLMLVPLVAWVGRRPRHPRRPVTDGPPAPASGASEPAAPGTGA